VIRGTFRMFVASCRLSVILVFAGLWFAPQALAADEPSVTAQYAVVVDADTGAILYDKSMDTPAAPASLTKIFTTIYALQAASLDRTLTVDQSDLVGESSMGLQAGETITLKTALYGMLLPSGNDAAMTVAQNLGAEPGDTPQQSVDRYVGWVNDMASRLGLTHTHLVNPHGLDQQGHQTSARDLAAITMFALKNPTFRQIIGTPYYNGDGHEMYQANRLLGSYPGLIGGKTGITDNAGYCLVEVAERNGHTIISVVMDSTDADWYQDATTLLDYGFAAVGSGNSVQGTSPITLAPVVIQPGMVQTAATPSVASAPATSSSANHLSVRQVSDNVAVVSHSLLTGHASGFSWKWPLTSLLTMIVLLAIVLNYPIVIGAGSLLWRYGVPTGRAATMRLVPARSAFGLATSGNRSARQRRNRRHRRQPIAPPSAATNQSPIQRQPAEGIASVSSMENVVSLNAAETIGTRAVRLARRGEYHAAASEFARALRTDSTFDLTRCSGFWAMQPAGYVAAARAYALNDRTSDAKSLLTVIKLSCGSHRELESLLNQVVTPSTR
jgi:D-alanyl-D-alanine carboxypeptidase (penicillin-binding protein 5/6)